MKRNWILIAFATLSFGGVLVVNTLASLQFINGLSTKQVSDLYPNLFTPAGITFSIWSVIYLLIICFLILVWHRRDSLLIEKILPWFIASCGLNILWIVVWHHLLPVLSVITMLCLLLVLSRIFVLVRAHSSGDKKEKAFVVAPFTIYLAWICVATIANIAALFVHWNWEGGIVSQVVWTIIMMMVASVLALLFLKRFSAWAFPLVVIWALLGICFRWNSGEHPSIFFAAIFLISGLTAIFTYKLLRSTSVDQAN